jgi:hypothetical protein
MLDAMLHGRAGEPNDANGEIPELRLARLPVHSEPHLVWDLRADVVDAQGRQQADDPMWYAPGDQRHRVVSRRFCASETIQATGDTLRLPACDEASEMRP